MKPACQGCSCSLGHEDEAYICSYECTWCPACRETLSKCPNCAGVLQRRPTRISNPNQSANRTPSAS
ncbi:MAG: DUF1272 domain-containing protein [Gammaproteobacteria bacterium]|nr:DUF1272 domain-containing protein [Gammaproteobacteria bacterium]